uniref:Uncharacterized protein n=1 Tax=Vombatus ursinus TaxID=29139 RepID=A0A4X2K004_VOMUR
MAAAGAGAGAAARRFFRCNCFCSEHLFLPRYRLHVRYLEEQQLRQDYGLVLKNRGCVSPEDFEQVLAEERFMASEFRSVVQYCATPDANLPGLLERIETLSEEKRIYRLPVFTLDFCRMLLKELEHFEQSDMPKGRPNTMNNHGVLLYELGLDEPLVTPLREEYLQPLTALLYPDCGGGPAGQPPRLCGEVHHGRGPRPQLPLRQCRGHPQHLTQQELLGGQPLLRRLS